MSQRDLFTADRKDYTAYRVWRGTEDGLRVWSVLQDLALAETYRGATRLSVKFLVEKIRHDHRVTIDNSFTALLADDLARCYPHMAKLIERRVRKSAALNPSAR